MCNSAARVAVLALVFGLLAPAVRAVNIIDIIPKTPMDLETFDDAEPSIAVSPADHNLIVVSAFTRGSEFTATATPKYKATYCLDKTTAPLFVSTDGGAKWGIKCILPSANAKQNTRDITIGFSHDGAKLYAAALIRKTATETDAGHVEGELLEIAAADLKKTGESGPGMMKVLHSLGKGAIDYPTMATSKVQAAQVYITHVDPDGNLRISWVGSDSKLAVALQRKIEKKKAASGTTAHQGAISFTPPSRVATHMTGAVYAAAYATDLNTFSAAAALFYEDPTALKKAFVEKPIAHCTVSTTPVIGFQRFSAPIALAVYPDRADAGKVIAACWGDKLYIQKSDDHGGTWTDISGTFTSLRRDHVLNPSLAIVDNKKVALLYQQLGTGGGWETRLAVLNANLTLASDTVIAAWSATAPYPHPDATCTSRNDGTHAYACNYLGEYSGLTAVGNDVYGVFSASNALTAGTATYLRTHPAAHASIDPYFFKHTP